MKTDADKMKAIRVYLEKISKTVSLDEAQREARLAIRIIDAKN